MLLYPSIKMQFELLCEMEPGKSKKVHVPGQSTAQWKPMTWAVFRKVYTKPVFQSWVRYDCYWLQHFWWKVHTLHWSYMVLCEKYHSHTHLQQVVSKKCEMTTICSVIKEYYIQHSPLHHVGKNSTLCHFSKRTGQNYQNGIFGIILQNKLSENSGCWIP